MPNWVGLKKLDSRLRGNDADLMAVMVSGISTMDNMGQKQDCARAHYRSLGG